MFIAIILLFLQHPPVTGDSHYLPRDKLAAVFECVFGSPLQTSAAGHLHANYGHALDVVACDYLGELFGVVYIVKLGAADKGYPAFHEILVHIGVCVGGAVGSDKQLCAVIKRCVCGQQLYLTRPLVQP